MFACSRFRLPAGFLAALSVFAFMPSAMGQSEPVTPTRQTSQKAEAGVEVNAGVEAYRAARYEEAAAHFQRAVDLNPDQPFARLYLATALSQMVMPGLDTPDNKKLAQRAVGLFKQILAVQPDDVNTLKQVAAVYYAIQDFEEAKAWQFKVLAVDPSDSEAAYTVGVIDWTLAHQNALTALQNAGLNDDGMGNTRASPNVLANIAVQNRALVDEALLYLTQAIADRPNYDDAMVYLNLIYRRKADLDWSDERARTDDLNRANDWRKKSMETRKANESKRDSGSAQP